MRARNALPLDDDITDRILIFLPDFASLHATMLASKAFYTVFKAHPNSITRAIAYNVAGPALPQAMRAIRYQHPESDGDDDGSDPVVPWAEADTISPITQDEIKELTANATVVGPLEDLFSMRSSPPPMPISFKPNYLFLFPDIRIDPTKFPSFRRWSPGASVGLCID